MLYRCQESIQCLTGQCTSARIRHGNGKHQRNLSLHFLHGLACCKDSSLGIQRVENGFNQDSVHSSFQQSLHLFLVSICQLIKSYGTESRIIHIRTHGTSLIGRTDRTRYKTRFIRILASIFIGQFTSQLGCSQIYLPTTFFHMIVSHGNTLRIEAIRFNDISTDFQIFSMNILNHMRSRQA